MQFIAQQVLGTNSTSVTFSSIPQTFRDLVLIINARQTSGTGQNQLRFNGNSLSQYATVSMEATGTAQQSGAGQGSTWIFVNLNNGDLDAVFTTTIVNIMDYSVTDKVKPVLSRGNNAGSGTSTGANAHRWVNTEAIDSVTCQASGTYAAGSTFTLFGIVA